MSEAGDELRIRRILAHIPQYRVAAAAGISQNRLSEIELGKTTPTPEMVEKLKAALILLAQKGEGIARTV